MRDGQIFVIKVEKIGMRRNQKYFMMFASTALLNRELRLVLIFIDEQFYQQKKFPSRVGRKYFPKAKVVSFSLKKKISSLHVKKQTHFTSHHASNKKHIFSRNFLVVSIDVPY